MCDRLQVGSAGASDAEQVNNSKKVYCIYPDITPKISEGGRSH